MSTILPVESELRQQLAGEVGVDIGHAQNVEHGVAGLPIGWNLPWFGIVLNGVGVVGPLAPNVFDKTGVPLPVAAPVFPPIQNELWHGIFDKAAVYVGPLQNFQGIGAGLPIRRDWQQLGFFGFFVLVLFPAFHHILGKGAVPGGAGIALVAPVGDKFRQHGVDKSGFNPVKAGQVVDAFPVWLPAAIDGGGTAVALIGRALLPWCRPFGDLPDRFCAARWFGFTLM